ncbi:hypothetical protein KW805_01290 [Candidatus Pacearchaeota archaeon]|nr:hypothetical protein [Candidatus Pacearchaeota archaeon]
MELQDLQKAYLSLSKQYKLPSFKEMNEDFEIDKIERESDTLLRVIRKMMMEKVVNSLTFLEMLINPTNTPRIYFSYIRSMSADDRKIIDDIYTILGELSILSLDLEIDYAEKKEASIIQKIFTTWKSVKPKFKLIMDHMKKPNGFTKRERNYFG